MRRRLYFADPTQARRAKRFQKKFQARKATLLAKGAGVQPESSITEAAKAFGRHGARKRSKPARRPSWQRVPACSPSLRSPRRPRHSGETVPEKVPSPQGDPPGKGCRRAARVFDHRGGQGILETDGKAVSPRAVKHGTR